MKTWETYLAKAFSILGHPLLLGTLYVVLMSYRNLDGRQALTAAICVMGIVTLPILVHNWKKTRKGQYTNFDVSDRQQRKGFYLIALGLMLVLLLALWYFGLPSEVLNHTLLFLGMVISMALLNRQLKASMHAALAIYVAVNLFGLGNSAVVLFLVFAVGVTWSRWKLGRHTLGEILLGAAVGAVFGLLSVGM